MARGIITFSHTGNFDRTRTFLKRMKARDYISVLRPYAEDGVKALAEATPKDTGRTAASWGYEIRQTPSSVSIVWTNSNVVDGVPIALVIQYGHVTATGGYVQGRDYINPALKPIFDKILYEVWKEVVES